MASQEISHLCGQGNPGDVVKIYRDNKGWTQTELGEHLGAVHKNVISSIENGRRSISKKMAFQLSEVFKEPAEHFLKI